MVVQQRMAAFRLVVVGTAIALFAVAAARVGVWRAQLAFTVIGVLVIEPLLFRAAGGACDERDQLLHLRATRWGTGLFWLFTTVGLWTAYALAKPLHQVPADALAMVAWLESVTFLLCSAVATLVVYRLS